VEAKLASAMGRVADIQEAALAVMEPAVAPAVAEIAMATPIRVSASDMEAACSVQRVMVSSGATI